MFDLFLLESNFVWFVNFVLNIILQAELLSLPLIDELSIMVNNSKIIAILSDKNQISFKLFLTIHVNSSYFWDSMQFSLCLIQF